jgi:AraC-like DNA-binding protein
MMDRRNRQTVRFFELPNLPSVRAVQGINVTHDFHRHVHEGYCIGIITQGSRTINHGGVSTIISQKASFVINPGEVHACKSCESGHSYMILSIEAEYMQGVASQISGGKQQIPHFRNILIHDTELYLKIIHFFTLITDGNSELEKETTLLSLLSLIILRYSEAPPKIGCRVLHERTILRVCDFISEHYSKPLSLKQLAEEAGLSHFYFQRLFLGSKGISPHDYVMQVRIRKARQLLAKGCNIAHVALDTGFADQSHLTRSFKQFTGITPGGYAADVVSRSNSPEW